MIEQSLNKPARKQTESVFAAFCSLLSRGGCFSTGSSRRTGG